ncbi:unnamed protein product [Ceutorhynchus assimilis]|uniref:Uncharacterized protein n=1 Tax=Ceutorhynchus assimilis TaxID=467358 RepID=A0A9N9MIF9_9CUCU|nr:unnamed protein product [Ceutorhynchus assimilis]
MYDLYKKGRKNAVGRSIYEREFHKLKLSFKKPYVDTCYKCDTLNMQVKVANGEDKQNAERDLQLHQELANTAYDAKKIDKEAKIDLKKKCFSLDLQQSFPTPFIVSSGAFYKRQLWTYNLTIHDNATGESTNYMWQEAMASRGGNEIASCLYRHLKNLPDSISEVTFYSDTCGGQNKNSHVAAMFIKAQSKNPNLIINHKFLVPGHTHMECDIDHSMIEKQKKIMEIPVYHPHDWYQLVRKTGRKKQFEVHEMQQEEFSDFAALLKSGLICRKKDISGDTFSWHTVQWLQYKENGLVHYKTALSNTEYFKVLSCLRRRRKHVLKDFPVRSKYDGFIPISTEKKRDLCSLLCLITSVFHEFYRNLLTSMND